MVHRHRINTRKYFKETKTFIKPIFTHSYRKSHLLAHTNTIGINNFEQSLGDFDQVYYVLDTHGRVSDNGEAVYILLTP